MDKNKTIANYATFASIASAADPSQDINQKKEYTKKGSLRLIPGLRLFSYNYKTKLVEEVKINDPRAIELFSGNKMPGTAQYDDACEYFQALNQKSAEKKAKKLFKDII